MISDYFSFPVSSAPIVSIDEKCWMMHCLLNMSTNLVGPFIYPRMFALVRGFHAYKFPSDLDTNEKGLPPLMRCTGQGFYIIGKF